MESKKLALIRYARIGHQVNAFGHLGCPSSWFHILTCGGPSDIYKLGLLHVLLYFWWNLTVNVNVWSYVKINLLLIAAKRRQIHIKVSRVN